MEATMKHVSLSLVQIAAVATTLLLSACGGSDAGEPQQPPPAAQGIGPAGGTVTGPNGAQVSVPPNAVGQPTSISIAQSGAGAPQLPNGFDAFGTMYAFTPHGTTFAQPVTVTVPFDPAQLPAGSVPALFKTNAQGIWERVMSSTAGAGSISAQVSGFSWFIVGIGTAVLVASSTPNTAQGFASFSTTAIVDVDIQGITRTVATSTGTTASGLPLRLEVSFDRGTGANPAARMYWGNAPESLAYCTPGSSNPCTGIAVSASPNQIDVSLLDALLIFGGDPNIRAVLRGSITYARSALAPSITQPPAALTVAAGFDASFAVGATGVGLSYQWERSDNGGAFIAITGANGASYTLTGARAGNPPAGDNGAQFRVVVLNGIGSVTSAAATLTVTAALVRPVITAQPTNLTVPAGSIATFSVVATGTPPLSYEWHRNGVVVGSDSSSLSFIAAAADHNAQIDVRVSNAAGSVASAVAILTVTAPSPAPLSAVRIAGGNRFSYARSNSGALSSWGSDALEALGNGAGAAPRNVPGPISVVADAIALVKSYGSTGHGLAIRANGEVWGWGANQSGQLGNGTTMPAPVPAPMTNAGSVTVGNAVAVSGGVAHSLVLRADGTVLAAGGNPGDGTTTSRTFAAPVPGLSSIVAIASGASAAYALRSDGTVWAWGDNTLGALGDGTTIARSTPVQVSGLTNIVAIAAGSSFGLALDASGDVWAWGTNASGQLGDGSLASSRALPGKVTISGVAAIAAGELHALALMTDGTLRAWGENANGRLGLGDQVDRSVPVAIVGLDSVVAIAGGSGHSLAVRADGSVRAWGSNVSGELGLGSALPQFLAPQVVPGLNLD
jgi:alpha-tubulin suppressor-like RCC1 family protein